MIADRGPSDPSDGITRGRLARPRALGERLRRRRAAESTAGRGRSRPGRATAAAKPGPVALPKEPEPGPALPPLSYDAKGRRDPFVPIVLAKDKPGLSIMTFKLAGVIREPHPPRPRRGPRRASDTS